MAKTFFFPCGAAKQIGPRPHHCSSVYITNTKTHPHTHTHHTHTHTTHTHTTHTHHTHTQNTHTPHTPHTHTHTPHTHTPHTHTPHTHVRIPLDSYLQRITQETTVHALCGIRTRGPRNRVAADRIATAIGSVQQQSTLTCHRHISLSLCTPQLKHGWTCRYERRIIAIRAPFLLGRRAKPSVRPQPTVQSHLVMLFT